MLITNDAEIQKILSDSTSIALVGASQKSWRESNAIMQYLLNAGFTVYPINPRYPDVLGQKCFPDLRSLDTQVDIVNIFRNANAVIPIVEEAIVMKSKVVWMQSGVINDVAAAMASRAGLAVVMDRCIAVDHRRLCHAR